MCIGLFVCVSRVQQVSERCVCVSVVCSPGDPWRLRCAAARFGHPPSPIHPPPLTSSVLAPTEPPEPTSGSQGFQRRGSGQSESGTHDKSKLGRSEVRRAPRRGGRGGGGVNLSATCHCMRASWAPLPTHHRRRRRRTRARWNKVKTKKPLCTARHVPTEQYYPHRDESAKQSRGPRWIVQKRLQALVAAAAPKEDMADLPLVDRRTSPSHRIRGGR